MAFGKADRLGCFADEVVLLYQPPILQVPPFGTVEDVIETGLCSFAGLVGGTSKGLRGETGARIPNADVADQAMPELPGDLISGVAAETIEAQFQQVLDHL